MKNDEFISCSDMIMNAFKNIENISFEKSNKLKFTWKKILTKINKIGKNLYEHTSIIDLKNNILLIEADHPGWIQLLQVNSIYILNGLKMYLPELKITSLAYKIKGSSAFLCNIDYDKELKKESKKVENSIKSEEKFLKKYEKKEAEINNKIPDELLEKLNSLKTSMLTKNKDK